MAVSLTDVPSNFGAGGVGLHGDSYREKSLRGFLAEHKAALEELQGAMVTKVSLTVGHADLTEASNGVAQSINIGSGVLPTNAYIVGRTLRSPTQFTGGGATAVALDIGGTDTDCIVDGEDVLGGGTGARAGTSGVDPNGALGGQQLKATFTPDGSHNLADLTAGSITIDILYAAIP